MRISLLPFLVIVFGASAGCHWATGVQTCLRGEACPITQTCDVERGVCIDETAPPPPQAPVVPPIGPGPSEGEGEEGEGEPIGEEGEGEPIGEEGEGEPIGEEGEGEPIGEEGEGEPIAEGEGEGGITPPTFVCGNGALETGEQCDDADRLSGDGCSTTCRNDFQFGEQNEPNGDPATAFVVDLNEPAVMTGSLPLQGGFTDEDGIWLEASSPRVVRIQTFTQAGSDDCGGSEFFLVVHDESIETNFNGSIQRFAAYNSINSCAAMTIPLTNQFYMVYVGEATGQTSINNYRLQVTSLISRGNEAEPNDNVDDPELGLIDGLDVSMLGAINSAADVDVYAVHIPPGQAVRAEIVPTSSSSQCESFNARIALLDSDGVERASQPSAIDACPFIDGHGATPRHLAAKNTTATGSTRYIVVAKGSGGQAGALPYHLAVTIR